MRVLAILISCITTLFADWKDQIIAYDTSKHVPFQPEKLDYQLSWNGAINSGELTIEFGKHDQRYPKVFITHAYGRSTGPAYALFPYTFTFTSFASKPSYKPLVFVASEKDKKETIKTKNTFKAPGIIHHSTTTENNGRVHTKDHTVGARAVHDPITAMLAIRKLALNAGDTIKLCSHPFASPYLITVAVLGKEMHLSQACIKLDIQILKIDKNDGKLKSYKKLKKATMWISDDKQRIPIELRSKVFIGDVRAILVKREKI